MAVAVDGPLRVAGGVRAQSLEDARVDGHRRRGLLQGVKLLKNTGVG